MGDNGIATKARMGATNYQNAAIEEQKAINNLSDYIIIYMKIKNGG